MGVEAGGRNEEAVTPTDRLLACLDVCEASGLFDPVFVERARACVRVGLAVESLRVVGSVPALRLTVYVTGCLASVEGRYNIDLAELAAFAATLARVAEVAAKCDAILRAE